MAHQEDGIAANQYPMNVQKLCFAMVRSERAEMDMWDIMWGRDWMHYRRGLLWKIATLMQGRRWNFVREYFRQLSYGKRRRK